MFFACKRQLAGFQGAGDIYLQDTNHFSAEELEIQANLALCSALMISASFSAPAIHAAA
jgi:hypothetical protein